MHRPVFTYHKITPTYLRQYAFLQIGLDHPYPNLSADKVLLRADEAVPMSTFLEAVHRRGRVPPRRGAAGRPPLRGENDAPLWIHLWAQVRRRDGEQRHERGLLRAPLGLGESHPEKFRLAGQPERLCDRVDGCLWRD